MSRKPFPAAVVPLVLILAAGCTGLQRNAYLERRAEDHVISRPLTQVWPEVEKLLRDRGWNPQPDGELSLATEWHRISQGQGLVPTGKTETIPIERLVAKGTPLADGRCMVEIIRQERMWHRVEYGVGRTAVTPPMANNTVPMGTDVPDDLHESSDKPGPTLPMVVHRDLGLEWALIERVEPAWAAAHEQVASKQYR